MQHHLSLPGNPGVPASEILKTMPVTLGKERNDTVFQWIVDRGAVPSFLCHWQEVSFEDKGHSVTFYCLPDFLCLGTDEDWVYCPVGGLTAELIARSVGAHLPTPKLVDIIYSRSNKQVAQPWGPPYDGSMKYTSRWLIQTEKVRNAPSFRQGSFMEGHLKNVCVSRRMERKKGEWLSFYGWFRADGKPIQGNNVDAHGVEYADYAHGVRLLLDEVVVDDHMMPLDVALKDEEYGKIFDPEGPMGFGNYVDCRRHYGITRVLY